MSSASFAGRMKQVSSNPFLDPVVHLELQTGDPAAGKP
jgi:hypothetical protein